MVVWLGQLALLGGSSHLVSSWELGSPPCISRGLTNHGFLSHLLTGVFSFQDGLAFEFGDQMNGVHPLNDFAEKVGTSGIRRTSSALE